MFPKCLFSLFVILQNTLSARWDGHILGVESFEFFWQVVSGVDAVEAGDQRSRGVRVRGEQGQESRPLVFDPRGVEVVFFRAEDQHDFVGVQGVVDVGFVRLTGLERFVGEEHPQSCLGERRVEVVPGDFAVDGQLAAVVFL